MKEDTMALPPKYYQKPNSWPRFLLSLVTLFIMLGALPVGVYLVGQRTSVLPQAAPENVERQGTVSFTLEKDDQFATTSAQIAVNLLAHSDEQAANLFATRITFPSQNLELIKVATSAAELQGANQEPMVCKWIEAKIDNQAGQFNLIAGVPNPGVQTDPDDQYIMAKLIFNVKGGQTATLHLDPYSTIFSNSDNKSLEVRKNDLTFELPVVAPVSSPTPTPRARFIPFRRPTFSLDLINPQGGETIGYNTSSVINWTQEGLGQIAVNLIVNDQKLGQIASVSADLGKLDWKPADFILPTFLVPVNTYKIELESLTRTGEKLNVISAGPFAIVNRDIDLEASQAANLAKRGGDANKDGNVDLTDLSILLSSFGQKDNLDLGVDLNGDGAVNDVDLWLFKGVLLR